MAGSCTVRARSICRSIHRMVVGVKRPRPCRSANALRLLRPSRWGDGRGARAGKRVGQMTMLPPQPTLYCVSSPGAMQPKPSMNTPATGSRNPETYSRPACSTTSYTASKPPMPATYGVPPGTGS